MYVCSLYVYIVCISVYGSIMYVYEYIVYMNRVDVCMVYATCTYTCDETNLCT